MADIDEINAEINAEMNAQYLLTAAGEKGRHRFVVSEDFGLDMTHHREYESYIKAPSPMKKNQQLF